MCLAVPGRVVEVLGADAEMRWAKVDFAGLRRDVSLACVPDAELGDYVLVHAGLAIARVDEAEARALLAALEAMGDADAVPG